ncbi:MAG: BNR-4 repeat-containing protein [Actinomycetota bacterium]
MSTRSRRELLADAGRLAAAAVGASALDATGARAAPLRKDDGYRGIWYFNQPSNDEYVYKYSGGFGTYPQQHIPIAYYSPAANKTFFCYGGTVTGKQELLHMVSYFDHATGMVPRPTVLLNKKTNDAHDNPTLMLDDTGHVWIFSNAHGTARPAYIHRSVRPHSVDEFEKTLTTNFSYSQPWHLPSKGFLFLHTRYASGRGLHWMTSPDGLKWSEPRPLAGIAQGHYQISWRDGTRLATCFNYHPTKGGLNARTNLYYLETADHGESWRTADGRTVRTPLTEARNDALIHDFEAEGLLVYLKDLQFDADHRPVLVFLTSKGYQSGPANDPRTWRTARWTGKAWEIRPITTSDHNYDFGSFYIEGGVWRLLAPTSPGPQPYCTGGEMVVWSSKDQGRTWVKDRELTAGSPRNHTYARRPVNAHPELYALWADGDAKKPSESHLYFTNRAMDGVWKLPPRMDGEFAKPERVR